MTMAVHQTFRSTSERRFTIDPHFLADLAPRRSVFQSGAVQRYPDLTQGYLKKSLSFLVEVDSVNFQRM